MRNELVPLPSPAPRGVPALGAVDLVGAFLSGRNPRTLDAYNRDLGDFARFIGTPDLREAVDILLAAGAGQANAIALGYRTHLTDRKLAAATIARRLAALRSVVKLAKTLGMVAWTLEIPSPRSEAYRDTSGPGLLGWRAMLGDAKEAAEAGTPKSLRDLALARLMHDLALRRGEAVSLDLADVDLEGGTVAVVGKGKTERVRITLPDPTRRDLARWMAARGMEPGPLFVRLDRAASGPGRLTGRTVHKIVGELGRRVGLGRPVRPHGLRHQAITRALDASGGNVREVQKFSRHVRLETLLRYDDNRTDGGGTLAKMVAEE